MFVYIISNAFASLSWTNLLYKFKNCHCTPYTFQKAYQALELLEDENNWNNALKGAALFQISSKL